MSVDYTKNHTVLYTSYRKTMVDDRRALLEPEHHIFYLDLCFYGRKDFQYTWAELAFQMRVSVRTIMSYMDRLGDIMLVSFPSGPTYSEDRPQDWIRTPVQPHEDDAGHDFVTDPDVLHEQYRLSSDGNQPLLSPLRHLLYLDLKTIQFIGEPVTLDDIRKPLNQLPRQELLTWLLKLKLINLVSFDKEALKDFNAPFNFTIKEPLSEDELNRTGREPKA